MSIRRPSAPRAPRTRPARQARPRGLRRAVLLAVALAALAAVAGCRAPGTDGFETTARRAPEPAQLTGWLAFDDTLRQATGHTRWRWVAPHRTCVLWLQVPVNTPVSTANGSRVWVDAVEVAGTALPLRVARRAPGDTGSYVAARLRRCVAAGTPVEFSVRFRGRAGAEGTERVGHRAGVSWWGSLVPAPAYATGAGWLLTQPVTTKGESQLQAVFTVEALKVTLPATARLAGPGVVRRGLTTGGRATWRLTSGPVRDLALVTGRFTSATAGSPDCQSRGLAPAGRARTARAVARAAADALRDLKGHFGFCPYPTTTVAAVMGAYGGMEFPGVTVVTEHDPVLFPRLVAHEIGHQYFYASIGSNPARHPWLDEAFATYAEALVNPATAADLRTRSYPASVRGLLAAPMRHWDAHPEGYSSGVYAQGATALLTARDTVGGTRFDDAVRTWLAVCGNRVCDPGDLRRVLREEAPAAIEVLAEAGAWRDRR